MFIARADSNGAPATKTACAVNFRSSSFNGQIGSCSAMHHLKNAIRHSNMQCGAGYGSIFAHYFAVANRGSSVSIFEKGYLLLLEESEGLPPLLLGEAEQVGLLPVLA